MIKIVASLLLFSTCCVASARDRPISSCDKAPLLAQMQKNLPDHIWGKTAEVPPKRITEMTRSTVPVGDIIRRSGPTLICIVIAIDATGKVQDAAISYPRIALTKQEREKLLQLQYSPAQQGGKPVPALVDFDIVLK